MNPQAILVGLAAGLPSALLFPGVLSQSAGTLGLSLAAPISIMIASLGWGSVSGFIAAASASLIAGLVTANPAAGFLLLATMAGPAAILGHLCGLARPREERTGTPIRPANDGGTVPLDWYPIERILFSAALLSALGCLFVGWMIAFDEASGVELLREALVASAGAGAQIDPAQIEQLAQLVISIVPFVQPAFLVITLVTTLYLAAAVTRMSGRLPRPRDDLPMTASLPRIAMPVFAAALALSFLDGTVGQVAAVFAGAFGAAFTLVGLALFHARTRGRAVRGLLLFTVYFSIVLLTFPLLVFLVFGLFAVARRPGGGRSPA